MVEYVKEILCLQREAYREILMHNKKEIYNNHLYTHRVKELIKRI